jgi:CubicO group peptidase (beta-lactamase class C family)
MKFLKSIFKLIAAILILINLIILFSGKWYVYSVLANTVCKGRLGPIINEYKKDPQAVIEIGNAIEIPNATTYNKKNISPSFKKYVNELGTVSFLVLKNDSVLHEEYWDSWNKDSLSNSYSMAKSFVSLLIGCAIHDGLIKNVNEPICTYLPDFNCDVNQPVTIKHLLTMSSAIDFNESYINPFVYAAEALYGNDVRKATYQHKLAGVPGKTFDYQSGNTQLLCLIIEKVTGKKLAAYASEKLWKPMGATKTASWSLDTENGLARAFCCFNSNARDFSRFGILLNHNGNFAGKQVIDSNYIDEATTPANWIYDNKPATFLKDEDGAMCKKYGYQIWLVNYKGLEIKYCRGILGQYIISIPAKNIVAVRLGHKRSKEKINGHPVDLFTIIDEALTISN